MRPYSDTEVCENLDKVSPSRTGLSDANSHFDCNICLEESQDPVVTMCGHLFCWSCLHQWITVHSVFKECPVCKACIKDKIIPLHGRGKACFANPGAKDMHTSARPHRSPFYPSAETNGRQYAARCGYVGQQNYGIVAQENYASENAYFTSSAVSFGLFPALFGLHGSTVSLENSRHILGNSFNSLALRRRAVGTMPFQQVRVDFVHQFILYWFLMLLAGFTISCLLLF